MWIYGTEPEQREDAEAIYECGTQLWVALGPDGPTLLRSRCRHRACQQCARYRSREVGNAISTMMEAWRHTKFITLTKSPPDNALRETVQQIVRDFQRLRRTALWKACAGPGVWTVEVKRSADRHHWHVHIHTLVSAKYIPQAALADAWQHITKTSRVVDIRAAVPSHSTYLAKYIAKHSSQPLEPWERWAYINELDGVRLVGTYGGAPSITDCKPDPQHTLIAPLQTVQRWAMDGDVWAQELLSAILEAQTQPRGKANAP